MKLFVTGMFRSGTTLVGRMLHAHRHAALASDGLFPFFKSFRNAVAADRGLACSREFEAPLADYAFGEQRALLDAILAANLDLPLDQAEIGVLRQRIAAWSASHFQYSPLLAPRVAEAGGETYGQFLADLLHLVRQVYGGDDTRLTAFKEVWTNEFVPALARSFPEMRFLCVVRDPRAVFASKKFRESMYPPFFLARQWRKLSALGLIFERDPMLSGRFRLLRFEDILARPEETARGLCAFLGLDWDEGMVQPQGFVDGRNEPWVQNSAYNDGTARFRPETIGRWREKLSPRETAFIEYACGPEMALLGYEPEHCAADAASEAMLLDPPLVPEQDIARWIKPFADVSLAGTLFELGREAVRHRLLAAPPEALAGDGYAEALRRAFLDERLFPAMRGSKAQATE